MSVFTGIMNTFRGATERLLDKAILIGLVLLVVLTSGGFWLHSLHPFAINTAAQVHDLLIGNIQAESVLTTASQDVTANITVDRVAKFLGMPVGETNLVYGAVGKAEAGIDIDSLEVLAVDAGARSVTLRLPPATVSVSLNVARSETLANYRKWFGPKAGAEIYQEAQRQAYAAIKSHACSDRILEVASHNAGVKIEAILTKVGFKTVEFAENTAEAQACASPASPAPRPDLERSKLSKLKVRTSELINRIR